MRTRAVAPIRDALPFPGLFDEGRHAKSRCPSRMVAVTVLANENQAARPLGPETTGGGCYTLSLAAKTVAPPGIGFISIRIAGLPIVR